MKKLKWRKSLILCFLYEICDVSIKFYLKLSLTISFFHKFYLSLIFRFASIFFHSSFNWFFHREITPILSLLDYLKAQI